jgi:DNA-directed RNA polymerase specialized sigma24 family protein
VYYFFQPNEAAGRAMSGDKSVTHWIAELQQGNRDAAQHLWEQYFAEMVRFAAQKLRGRPRRAIDEEDVALSAMYTAFRKIEAGEYPRLNDRTGLWRLLMVITARKVLHSVRDEGRKKRGGNRAMLSAGGAAEGEEAAIEQILSREPTPQIAAEMAEQCENLLECLPDRQLRQLAIWKMEGHSNDDIAAQLQCTARTVERKLNLIRQLWTKTAAADCTIHGREN